MTAHVPSGVRWMLSGPIPTAPDLTMRAGRGVDHPIERARDIDVGDPGRSCPSFTTATAVPAIRERSGRKWARRCCGTTLFVHRAERRRLRGVGDVGEADRLSRAARVI